MITINAPASRRRSRAVDGLVKGSDPTLSTAAVALSVFGVVVVYSATRGTGGDVSFVRRQALFLVAGIIVMSVLSHVDPRRLRQAAVPVGAFTLVVLVAVLSSLGTEVRGTQGWFQLFGVSVQPAEFAKVSLVLAFGALLTSRRRINDRGRFVASRFMAALLTLGGFSALVLAGGETGSVLVYVASALGMFIVGGIPKRMIGLLLFSAAVGVALIWTSDVLEPYQRQRLEAFVDIDADPLGAGYNQRQSVTAIGSGGLSGKGLFNGPQTQLRYLPEQQTDFIFAVVSEELGFVGGLALVLAEGLILFRILAVSRVASDPFGVIVCSGVFCFLAIQVIQNVGMNLRLMPVTGIPLPFVSYGGSSLIAGFIALGLVRSVSRFGGQGRVGERHRSGQDLYSLTDDEVDGLPSRLSRTPAR